MNPEELQALKEKVSAAQESQESGEALLAPTAQSKPCKRVSRNTSSQILGYDFSPLQDVVVRASNGVEAICIGGQMGESGVQICVQLPDGSNECIAIGDIGQHLCAAGMSAEEAASRISALESNLTPMKPFTRRSRRQA